jgi:hypothetical protein
MVVRALVGKQKGSPLSVAIKRFTGLLPVPNSFG